MANLQYLDAEAIPYQVVLRDSKGIYVNQYPQSFFVTAEDGGFRAMGTDAYLYLTRQFSQIDWGACLPTPDPIPTDTEGSMRYLSTLFTGQQGTLIPPTPPTTAAQSMIISQPFTLDLTTDGLYAGSPVGGVALGNTVADSAAAIPAGLTLTNILTSITSNDISEAIPFDIILVNSVGEESSIFSATIKVAEIGVISDGVPPFIFSGGDRIAIRCEVPAGTGSVIISGVTMVFETA